MLWIPISINRTEGKNAIRYFHEAWPNINISASGSQTNALNQHWIWKNSSSHFQMASKEINDGKLTIENIKLPFDLYTYKHLKAVESFAPFTLCTF